VVTGGRISDQCGLVNAVRNDGLITKLMTGNTARTSYQRVSEANSSSSI
jgi:hypothetical protein